MAKETIRHDGKAIVRRERSGGRVFPLAKRSRVSEDRDEADWPSERLRIERGKLRRFRMRISRSKLCFSVTPATPAARMIYHRQCVAVTKRRPAAVVVSRSASGFSRCLASTLSPPPPTDRRGISAIRSVIVQLCNCTAAVTSLTVTNLHGVCV